MSPTYQREFYESRHRNTAQAANIVFDALLPKLPPVRSALDVGCGVGTWLSTLVERGVTDVFGLDGPWGDRELLRIPADRFRMTPLDKPWSAGRRFDLAISLEVAEHLPESSADDFVGSLAASADFVLFSAALPGQGGTNHLNEQPASYWAERFRRHGFALRDLVRPAIWEDRRVPVWYRQNALVFVQESRLGEVEGGDHGGPIDLVHPDLFRRNLNQFHGPEGVLRAVRWTIKDRPLPNP